MVQRDDHVPFAAALNQHGAEPQRQRRRQAGAGYQRRCLRRGDIMQKRCERIGAKRQAGLRLRETDSEGWRIRQRRLPRFLRPGAGQNGARHIETAEPAQRDQPAQRGSQRLALLQGKLLVIGLEYREIAQIRHAEIVPQRLIKLWSEAGIGLDRQDFRPRTCRDARGGQARRPARRASRTDAGAVDDE